MGLVQIGGEGSRWEDGETWGVFLQEPTSSLSARVISLHFEEKAIIKCLYSSVWE